MNNLIPFSFESHEIRVVMQDGSPWWIAMDVASVLDYSDTEAMTRRLDDDEVQNLQIVGFGPRGVTVINESGLYSAILGSRKPDAKKFKKWVAGEVLPSIRKTGSYALPHAQPALDPLALQLAVHLSELLKGKVLVDHATLTDLAQAVQHTAVLAARIAGLTVKIEQQGGKPLFSDLLAEFSPRHNTAPAPAFRQSVPVSSPRMDVRAQVLAVITNAGEKGIRMADLPVKSWSYRKLTPEDRQALLQDLLDSGEIAVIDPVPNGKAGRQPVAVLVAKAYALRTTKVSH